MKGKRMYLAERADSTYFMGKFNSFKTIEEKCKNLDELAVYCLLQTQGFFLNGYKEAKMKPLPGRVDVADDHYKITYAEFIDKELAIEMFFVEKDIESLEKFMNFRCEQYRVISNYKFTKN